jgi:hypothetical protein
VICADEPERYVVRVFVGRRDDTIAAKLPPWRDCLVFAVPKDRGPPSLLVDDARYRPTIR